MSIVYHKCIYRSNYLFYNLLVKQYTKLFADSNASPEFSDSFLAWIAGECTRKNRGARGLRTVFENALNETMYIIPSLKEFAPKVYFDKTQEGRTVIRFTLHCYDKDSAKEIFDRCDFGNAILSISYTIEEQ